MHPLVISRIERNTADCVLVTFDVPDLLKDEYRFIQGQYLTLEADIKGEKVRRSYSICSPVGGPLRVGIKKLAGGLFSTYANEVLRPGDTVNVDLPRGKFYVPVDSKRDRHLVFFAAGSGITPVFSLIKTYLEWEPHTTIQLFYVNKTVSSIVLKEELESLKNEYMQRLEINYLLTRQSRSIPLFDGRVDQKKLVQFEEAGLLIFPEDAHYFMCGPEFMILDIEAFLKQKGIIESRIHFELFHAGPVDAKKMEELRKLSDRNTAVTVIEGGKTLHFDLARGSNNLLDAALANNADLPYACKGGVCCTCRAKLVEGEVEMLLSYGLEQDEIDDGYILTCQSFPMTDKVVVDFDS